MSEKLSFRKKISLVKATVVKTLIESKELSKLGSGSSKNGYYSLSTIMEVFQPALVDNDLDFDITMDDNEVVGTWIDCESDKVVDVVFKLGRLAKIIENLERLPQMQNAIQTEGSIKTYFRRYALTAFLNLPATDEIDSKSNNKDNDSQNNGSENKDSGNQQKVNNLEKEIRDKLMNILYFAAKKDKNKAIELLEKYTSFTGKDGKDVPGITDINKLKDKRLNTTYGRVQKDYPELYAQVKELYENKMKEKKGA